MRAVAIPMILLMLSASFAGCTSDDPDGNDNSGIDMEILNEMIDDNLQDFINNTSVTVNQEIHHHNNTTVVNNIYETSNEYSNTTNMDGGTTNIDYEFGDGVNGSVFSNGQMYVVHLEWSAMDMFPNYFQPGSHTNNFSIYWNYYDEATSQNRNDTFEFNCDEYYILAMPVDAIEWVGTYWQNSGSYYDAWDNQYNDTIAGLLQSVAYNVQSTCDYEWVPTGPIQSEYYNPGYAYQFLNITIPEGYAIEFRTWHFQYFRNGALWEDNYQYYSWSEGYRPAENSVDSTTFNQFYGGWEDITIQFTLYPGDYDGGMWSSWQNSDYAIWPDSSYRLISYYEIFPVTQHTE